MTPDIKDPTTVKLMRQKELDRYNRHDSDSPLVAVSDFQSSYIYRPQCSMEKMIHADSAEIKHILGVEHDEVLVISFSEDTTIFLKSLECISELSIERDFVVSGNRWIEGKTNIYKIPGTDIVVCSRDYGHVIRKRDYEAVKKFITSISLSPSSYDEPALDKVYWDNKTSSLKNDVNFFAKSKHWFDKRDLPYSRSYLLYGAPGNGKTSAIRAISKFFGVEPSQFSFTGRYEDPDFAFLSWVAGSQKEANEPVDPYSYRTEGVSDLSDNPKIRIILLEDIDRFFSREEGIKTPVSFSAILNALDGVDQRKNSILIATANNPEKIDSQVLFRPGRFDLRIPFDAPDRAGISSFLTKLVVDDNVSDGTIEKVSDLARGHSFAFVKGVYMAAANKAFSRASEVINDEDIITSLNEFLANMGKDIKSSRGGAGF